MTFAEDSALTWRKSTHSDGTGGECVELAAAPDTVLVRDSKDPDGPVLDLTSAAARDLLNRIRRTQP